MSSRGFTPKSRAVALVVIQCLLVSSIAAKYLYERATRPRVWTRTVQYDPNLPLRGRYLALTLMVDTCSLDQKVISSSTPGRWNWQVRTVARDGKLVGEDARDRLPRSDYQSVSVGPGMLCERAELSPYIDFFVPDTAKSLFPLKPGQELWVEVTVPPSGPPRAIQLALSGNGNWRVLKFN